MSSVTNDPPPFHVALRAAITASGLPLDRIRHRLQLRQVPVSVPTLSNWQSGRRRPERPESLRALAELESVLDLPPSTLRSLLGPPRPRGRSTVATQGRSLTAVWGETAGRLLSAVDTSSDSKLVRLSHHDLVRVDNTGQLSRLYTRQVLRAGQDGADRWIAVWESRAAEVIAGRHCRLGQLRTDAGLTVAELLFDQPLARGETAIIEYHLRYPRAGGDRFLRRFHLPAREYVLEADFHPAALPTQCFRTDSGETVVPNSTGFAHLVGLNVTGKIGIQWVI
jgi:transcriptional regulator with XRE-family HTH domain